MFKRSFLKEHSYRFHPEVVTGEDQLFVIQCYLTARVITVVADYSYYFVVARGNENLSKKIVRPDQFFLVRYRVMEFINKFICDENCKRKIKIAYLNRFLRKSPLRKRLLTSQLTDEQKKVWLNETKRFIDTHIDDDLTQSLNPDYHFFLRAAKENDIHKLAKVKM